MERVPGIDYLTKSYPRPVLTIGNFDGVHLGHQRILTAVVEKAREVKGTAMALTFRPHPQAVLHPGKAPGLLSTYDEKASLLAKAGIEVLIEQPFSLDFAGISADDFFRRLILGRIRPAAVIIGYDFAFGKGKSGSIDHLTALAQGAGVSVSVIPAFRLGKETVSSSRIREYLMKGQIEEANELLGREFSYFGKVVPGERRGRKLGFPTANLELEEKLALPYGVYASYSVIHEKTGLRKIPSVTNLGVRPTFHAEADVSPLVETHLLDFTEDLYGKIMEVRFVRRLRGEQKFDGVESLKKQIRSDVTQARQVLGLT